MERAYKFLLAGLVVGLVVAAVGTYALTAGRGNADNGLALDCSQCHAQGHGSTIAPNPNMNGTILLTGDTPQDEYVMVEDIFAMPQKNITTLETQIEGGVPSRGVPLLDLLEAHGVDDFDEVIFYSDDFLMKMDRSDVNEDTVLVPMNFSVRVIGPNMPVSAWAKGVRTIDVIGPAGDRIAINGKDVSFGRMLDDGVQTLPISLRAIGYEFNGTDYQYETAFVATGIGLRDLLFKEGIADFRSATVGGISLSRQGVLTGSYFITRDNGTIKLATADKSRLNWPVVKSITVE